ncbi:MAG TPA: cysteine hydrolase [Chloroflexota bacterium]|nr:cysteine hydrolase [Chloroflexota bacterium]
MPVSESLDPRRTALVFFDMLKGYHYDRAGRALLPEDRPLADACVHILNAARSLGLPVVYAAADHRADHRDASPVITDLELRRPDPPPASNAPAGGPGVVHGSVNAEVIDEIKPQPGDYEIRKHRWSAFHQTELELSLRSRGVDTILLAGGSTEVGVASTAYAARDLDFNVVILRDAVSSGRGPTVSDFYVDQIFPQVARVRTVDEAIAMLHAGGQHG